MDTSKQYILMCEGAKEIQNLCTEKQSHDTIDPVSSWDGTLTTSKANYFYFSAVKGKPNYFVWLPRQDQLQEMVKSEDELAGDGTLLFSSAYRTLDNFVTYLCGGEYWDGGIEQEFFEAMSIEQLWLAFVMKEKYGKTWNGSEWKI